MANGLNLVCFMGYQYLFVNPTNRIGFGRLWSVEDEIRECEIFSTFLVVNKKSGGGVLY